MAESRVIVNVAFDGCLPVRVLQYNVLKFFLEGNARAGAAWEEEVAEGRISCEILLDIQPAAVRGPSINYETKQIEIQEAFEAALWASSYGILVLHDCLARKYARGEKPRELDISDPCVKDAFAALAYVETLFTEFCQWPESLPNPESYSEESRDLVEKTNNLYVSAAAFALAHEFGHVALGHGDAQFHDLLKKVYSCPSELTEDDIALLRQRENDADLYAVQHFLSGIDDDADKTVRLFGIVITYLCLLIGKRNCSQLETTTHPNLGTRILNTLNNEVEDVGFQDSLRGAVILALTYFLGRHGVDMGGVSLEDSMEGLRFCFEEFDLLRTNPPPRE